MPPATMINLRASRLRQSKPQYSVSTPQSTQTPKAEMTCHRHQTSAQTDRSTHAANPAQSSWSPMATRDEMPNARLRQSSPVLAGRCGVSQRLTQLRILLNSVLVQMHYIHPICDQRNEISRSSLLSSGTAALATASLRAGHACSRTLRRQTPLRRFLAQ